MENNIGCIWYEVNLILEIYKDNIDDPDLFREFVVDVINGNKKMWFMLGMGSNGRTTIINRLIKVFRHNNIECIKYPFTKNELYYLNNVKLRVNNVFSKSNVLTEPLYKNYIYFNKVYDVYSKNDFSHIN